jgi:diacylglycerol kinase family enzyme
VVSVESRPNETTRHPVLLNPRAGSAHAFKELLAAEDRVELKECEPHALHDHALAVLRGGARRLIVTGGDGSIATVAGAIVEHAATSGERAELAVLPGGTFNHFAKEHGIPLPPDEALVTALGDSTASVDAACVNGRVFLNTSSVGAYVRFVATRERLEPRLGYWIASLVAAVRTVFWQRLFDVELEVDGVVRRYRSAVVFIGVGERETRVPMLGKRLDDGRRGLHVIVVDGAVRGRLVAVAITAAALGLRALARTPQLDTFVVDRCTIEMRRTRGRVALDGELVLMDAPLRYEIIRDALTITVPTAYHSDSAP